MNSLYHIKLHDTDRESISVVATTMGGQCSLLRSLGSMSMLTTYIDGVSYILLLYYV